MFKIRIIDSNNQVIREDNAGTWEDRAREQFGQIRRKLIHNTDIKVRAELVDIVGDSENVITFQDQRFI